MAKGIRTILETILLANSFTQALSMIGRRLLLFLSVCCISEITYQARTFRNKNKNIFCSVFHVCTIKIIDIEKIDFLIYCLVRLTVLCVLFCLSLRFRFPTLSQKQFLGSKYFTILHENVRDIALKMYRL